MTTVYYEGCCRHCYALATCPVWRPFRNLQAQGYKNKRWALVLRSEGSGWNRQPSFNLIQKFYWSLFYHSFLIFFYFNSIVYHDDQSRLWQYEITTWRQTSRAIKQNCSSTKPTLFLKLLNTPYRSCDWQGKPISTDRLALLVQYAISEHFNASTW
jgi:hypothetical protein